MGFLRGDYFECAQRDMHLGKTSGENQEPREALTTEGTKEHKGNSLRALVSSRSLALGRRLGRYCSLAFVLVRAEAQQGGNVAGLLEFRVVLHIEQFNIAPNGRRDDGFADVL